MSDLGSSLLLALDPEDVPSLDGNALAAGIVTSITDSVGGRVFSQAVTGSKPAFLLDSKGRRIIRPDATDDSLRFAGAHGLVAPFDIWWPINQTVLAANTGPLLLADIGNGAASGRISYYRDRSSGTNRARVNVGNGVTQVAVINSAVDFSGPCVVRLRIGASAAIMEVNQVTMTAVAAPVVLATDWITLFGNGGTTAAQFGGGDFYGAWITKPLTGAAEANAYALCNARIA